MLTGIVKLVRPHFGIIEPNGAKKEDPDVFFHESVIEGFGPHLEQRWVEYEVIDGYISKHGTLKATRVALCKKRGEHERSAARENERKNVIPIGGD